MFTETLFILTNKVDNSVIFNTPLVKVSTNTPKTVCFAFVQLCVFWHK